MAIDRAWVEGQDIEALKAGFAKHREKMKKEGAHSSQHKLSVFLNSKFGTRTTDDRRALGNLIEGRTMDFQATRGAGSNGKKARTVTKTYEGWTLEPSEKKLLAAFRCLFADDQARILSEVEAISEESSARKQVEDAEKALAAAKAKLAEVAKGKAAEKPKNARK